MRWMLFVLMACGRVGFDAVPGGSPATDGRNADGRSGDGAGQGAIDAALAACDPTACATAGGSCQANACVITCNFAGCMSKVRCPPDSACTVTCASDACQNGVDCGSAGACTVQCTGVGSCQAAISCTSPTCDITCAAGACTNVNCGPGRCTIDCSALGACSGALKCGSACRCDAMGNPADTATCPGGCANGMFSCSSTGTGCNPGC